MTFANRLVAFNKMYGLPVNDRPTNLGAQRLKDLKVVLQKEVDEIDDIIAGAETDESAGGMSEMQILVGMADLMGDLQVYAGSELTKWGLPMNAILYIIMASNMSKLGADGLPIIDGNGKVVKGPNYWKPEPLIKKLLIAVQDSTLPVDTMWLADMLVTAKQAELAGVA